MNPYLSGIMALSQLSPEQFDMGMQRFQQIQGMQPQGLSALQARQTGLTAGIPQGPASKQFDRGTIGGNVGRPALSPRDMNPISDVFQKPDFPAAFYDPFADTPYAGTGGPRPNVDPPIPTPVGDVSPNTGNSAALPGFTDPYKQAYTNPYSSPLMTQVSGMEGSFGTGAMPYTQPYYQRSFNPYSGGFGMGQPMSGGGKGGGSPYGGSYGRSNPYSSGYGMGFQQQPSTSPMGGGKGGGMPAYGGGSGGKGGRR
jgi:hypothetical protein